MNPIIKYAKPIFEERVKNLGFYGRKIPEVYEFYRLMDGFIQTFAILGHKRCFGVSFGVYPLCNCVTGGGGGIPSSVITGEQITDYKMMFVDKYIEEEVIRATNLMLKEFELHVLPWLEGNDTIEKAYQSISDLLPAFGEKPDFYWMMQMGKLEKAIEALELQIAEEDRMKADALSNPVYSMLHSKEQIADLVDFHNQTLESLNRLRNYLIKGGMDYLNYYVEKSTEKTLANLKLTK